MTNNQLKKLIDFVNDTAVPIILNIKTDFELCEFNTSFKIMIAKNKNCYPFLTSLII